MARRDQITPNELYHVCNRTVEGRPLFTERWAASFFLENLFVLNDVTPVPTMWRRRYAEHINATKDKKLVDIFALTLMPNHFHFLVRENEQNGLATLMQRSCNSLAKAFNKYHQRKGSLFMGRFKAVHVSSDVQADHLITYIHGNPLDINFPQWRDGAVTAWDSAEHSVRIYPYSSLGLFLKSSATHPIIKKIITTDFVTERFSPTQLIEALQSWSTRFFDYRQYIDPPF